MAKRGRKKKQESKFLNDGMYYKIIWFMIGVLAIMAIFRNGPAGKLLNSAGVFVLGDLHLILNIVVIIIGISIIFDVKISKFKMFFLCLILALAGVLLHMNQIDVANKPYTTSLNEVINFANMNLNVLKEGYGGGFIGLTIGYFLVSLFDVSGTLIVCWSLILLSLIIVTGISVVDIIKQMGSNIKYKASKKERKIKGESDVEINKGLDSIINNPMGNHAEDIRKSVTPEQLYINPEPKEVVKQDETVEINENYKLPNISILSSPKRNSNKENEEEIKKTVPILTSVFNDFGIVAKVVKANIGPSVTQYELEVGAGTKISRILGLNREIALALAAKDVRIQAPIPGKGTIGIEVPNKVINMVSVREILESVPSNMKDSLLLASLGRDIMGRPHWVEIDKTPHLLVAGATGSGKSVCINSLITSILMRATPEQVKFLLIDPKKVELSMYNAIPHLLAPVVTDPAKANIALKKVVAEMENRYDLFEESKTKNISSYNKYLESKGQKKIPYIVVIIDELADLMLVAAKEVEDSIRRITQMARAAGIHLIVATQRPSTDVITGVVKSNIPSRISFAVASQIDSRTILDMGGAEKLLGKGDMLFLPQGENLPIRIQGTFISDSDIKKLAQYTITQQKASYDARFEVDEGQTSFKTGDMVDDYDEPMYNEVVDFILEQDKASTSAIQRRFRFGYNRAARCMDLLEARGIVGPSQGSKPREVLVKKEVNDEDN
jgi:S-DNA-T family DNA segregation ATPase FtsK/SpoIIIE